MKQMRETDEMVKVASSGSDSAPRMIILVGALIGSVADLLLLLRRVGMEEKGYSLLREDVKKIVYED